MSCISKPESYAMRTAVNVIVLMCLSLAGAVTAVAQALTSVAAPEGASRLEVYGGYGFLDPVDSDIGEHYFPKLYKPNANASVAYYFSRHFGAEIEGSYFSIGRTFDSAGRCNAVPCSATGQRIYTAEAGPVYRYPFRRHVVFAHVLAGGEKVSGPYLNPLKWGYGLTAGVGFDYVLPYFHNLLAVRPIQADFQFSQTQFGPVVRPAETLGGLATITAAKLSGGVVLRLGGQEMDHAPHDGLMLDCTASPSSGYSGDPVEVTPAPMNLNGKKPYDYQWTSAGGRLTPKGDAATMMTAGMAPGEYTVNGTLTQHHRQAVCQTKFTIRPYEPPTISCQANPNTVHSGGVATIVADGVSPSSRQLVYSYTTDAGQITPIGDRAQLLTAGLNATTVHVTCSVADDLGRTASASTILNVTTERTAMPPLADTQALCAVSFERDRRRPVRVDNEAKACLDDIALTLAREPSAKLVIAGDSGAGEQPTAGAQRSLNVRDYLTHEKGVDAGRIEVRYGERSGRSVENVLVPAGTTYNNASTTEFDPASVRRIGPPYGIATPHARQAYRRAAVHRAAVRRHRRSVDQHPGDSVPGRP